MQVIECVTPHPAEVPSLGPFIAQSFQQQDWAASAQKAALFIYTSGTTGAPKGGSIRSLLDLAFAGDRRSEQLRTPGGATHLRQRPHGRPKSHTDQLLTFVIEYDREDRDQLFMLASGATAAVKGPQVLSPDYGSLCSSDAHRCGAHACQHCGAGDGADGSLGLVGTRQVSNLEDFFYWRQLYMLFRMSEMHAAAEGACIFEPGAETVCSDGPQNLSTR